MLNTRVIISLALGALCVTGCKKQPQAPATPVPVAAPSAPSPAISSTPLPPVSETPSLPAPPVTTPVPLNPTSLPALAPDTSSVTTTTPSANGDASPDDAKSLLADAAKNVEDKKFDAAGEDFKKLNAMKGLPQSVKDQITAAEAKFVAAKAGSGLKIPGLGIPDAGNAPSEPNK